MAAPRKKEFLMTSTLRRADDPTCGTCDKETILEGEIWAVDADGMTPRGRVIGCYRHEEWEWFDLEGKALTNVQLLPKDGS